MADNQPPKVIEEITSLKVSLARAHRLIEHFCVTNPELYYTALQTFSQQNPPDSIINAEKVLLLKQQGKETTKVEQVTSITPIADQVKEEKYEAGEILDIAGMSAISGLVDTFKEQTVGGNGRSSPTQVVVIPTALQPKSLIAVALATGKVSSVVSRIILIVLLLPIVN